MRSYSGDVAEVSGPDNINYRISEVSFIIDYNPGEVSWCRYTQDKRFTAIHGTDSNNWALKVAVSGSGPN